MIQPRQIYREEGLRSFWKGNGTNVIRVAPYAAAQLSSNDFYKRLLAGKYSPHQLPPKRFVVAQSSGNRLLVCFPPR